MIWTWPVSLTQRTQAAPLRICSQQLEIRQLFVHLWVLVPNAVVALVVDVEIGSVDHWSIESDIAIARQGEERRR